MSFVTQHLQSLWSVRPHSALNETLQPARRQECILKTNIGAGGPGSWNTHAIPHAPSPLPRSRPNFPGNHGFGFWLGGTIKKNENKNEPNIKCKYARKQIIADNKATTQFKQKLKTNKINICLYVSFLRSRDCSVEIRRFVSFFSFGTYGISLVCSSLFGLECVGWWETQKGLGMHFPMKKC